MSYTSRKIEELFTICPPLTKREDLDEFWTHTLKQTRNVPLNTTKERIDYPSLFVKVYEIAFNGFDETRIYGWFIVPNFMKASKYPCLIHYHGYGGNRGLPGDFLHWVMMGVAVISIDCRDQCGKTGNSAIYTGGSTQSVVCKGILDKNEYYFRAVYMDCIKAIDFACEQAEVDSGRIIIEGKSQGEALGMAVCALDSRPVAAMVDVPSNSNLESRIEGAHGAFASVTEYLKIFPEHTEKVFETLSYFDTMNLADRIKCKVLASVGLKDTTCPAEMYFATYNRIQSPKEILLYPFNGHEGGGNLQTEAKMKFLKKLI